MEEKELLGNSSSREIRNAIEMALKLKARRRELRRQRLDADREA